MNKKILFVCDYYYPNPTSIGLCVHRVAKEFRNRGYDVHVLCYGDKTGKELNQFEGISVHRVKCKFSEKLIYHARDGKVTRSKRILEKIGLLIFRIQQLVFFPWFRMSSLHGPYRYYKAICRIYDKIHFDVLCSSHAPFDGTLGAYWFKKKYPEIPYELYILDSLTNKGDTKWISAETNDRKGWSWEKRFYGAADLIINIKCNEIHNQNSRYDTFREKMYISDIPLLDTAFLRSGWSVEKETGESEKSILVYAGRMLSHLSSPDYLCRLISYAAQKKSIQILFYSSGDCREQIEKLDGEIFSYKGLVKHDELMCIYGNADILVSIGSKRADMLPSKIFEYMSTGKKILHIAKEYDDICVDHYKKYPQSLVLFEKDDFESNIVKLISFIDLPSVKVNMEELKQIFEENTPEHTVDIMEIPLFKQKGNEEEL